MHVIARAYGDEPLDREVVAVTRSVAYLENPSMRSANSDGLGGVGFPLNCIYEFDGELFRNLRAAFERRADDELRSLWNQARRAEQVS
jgi:hypothetical protein